MDRSARDNNFSILRMLAAVMVLGGHMFSLILQPAPLFLGWSIHMIGLNTFFLIGGYLITQSWLSDPHPVRYAVKRILRIWPPLIAFLLFATLVAGPVLTSLPLRQYFADRETWEYLVGNIALYIQFDLPGVFETMPYPIAVNGSLWTLPIEAAFYIMVPLVLTVFCVKRDRKSAAADFLLAAAAVVSCAANIAMNAFYPQAMKFFYLTDWVQALRLLPNYLIGMAYTSPRVRRYLNLPLAGALLIASLSFDMGAAAMGYIGRYLIYPYFVFSLALAPASSVSRFLDRYEISYGLYLYGFFIQQFLIMFFGKFHLPLNSVVLTLLAFAATAVAALVSRRLIEKPAAKLAKRINGRLSPKGTAG